MKYIILPVFKFVYSVFLTILVFILGIIEIIAWFLWSFKLYEHNVFNTFTVLLKWNDTSLSAYYKIHETSKGDIYNGLRTTYKSYFHYIWGII